MKKSDQYKLLLANNFLKNISLDGTHEDTSLRIFNHPGLPENIVKGLRQRARRDPHELINDLIVDSVSPKEVKFSQNVDIHSVRDPGSEKASPDAIPGAPQINIDAPSPPGFENEIPALDLEGLVKENMREFYTSDPKASPSKSLKMKRSGFLKTKSQSTSKGNFFSHSLSKFTFGKSSSGDSPSHKPSPPPIHRGSDPKTFYSRYRSMSLKKKISNAQSGRQPSWLQFSPSQQSGEGREKAGTFLSAGSQGGGGASPAPGSVSNLSEHSNPLDPSDESKPHGKTSQKSEMGLLSSLRSFSFKDKVCLVSSAHNPLVLYSILEYTKSTPDHFPNRRKRSSAAQKRDDISRTRQSSGSETTAGLRPFEFQSEEEVSYSRMLVPYSVSPHQSASASTGAMPIASAKRFFSEESEHALRVPRGRNVSRSSSCEPPLPSSPAHVFQRSDVQFQFESVEEILPELDFLLNEEEQEEEQSGPFSKSYHFESAREGDAPLYNPNIIDDPDFGSGEHRTTMKFPGYVATVVEFVNPEELKKESNEKFRERYPHVQITLSKSRSIKREMRFIGNEVGLDPLSLAQAFVYFEKLIFKALINKQNRKQVAAVCLLLSAKLNDIKGTQMQALFEKAESTFRVNRKEVMAYEVPVIVALEFTLHVPDWEVFPHFQKLQWAT